MVPPDSPRIRYVIAFATLWRCRPYPAQRGLKGSGLPSW